MARPADPMTPFRVKEHHDKSYTYAFVWRKKKDDVTQIERRCQFLIGRLDDNYRFTPNSDFMLLDVEERRKFIFPESWDIAAVHKMNGINYKPLVPISPPTGNPVDEPLSSDVINGTDSIEPTDTADAPELTGSPPTSTPVSYDNQLYGNVWLLEQWAIQRGVFDDLMTVFNNDYGKVSDILSLAIYRIVENRSFNRINRWRVTHKIMSDRNFYSGYITRFTQSIGESHRMKYIECRAKRQPKDTTLSADSTTRSGYGRHLVDVRWGHNKDDVNLKCSVEAYVYSLTTHEAVYYRRFSGDTSDMITISTIIKDLENAGFSLDSLLFITDRGYSSSDNMARYVSNECSFITCVKVNCKLVTDVLLKVNYDVVGYATNLEYDEELGLFYGQFDANEYTVMMDDGSLFTVTGIKVNVYYDPKDRQAEITSVHRAIDAEKKAAAKIRAGSMKVSDVSGLKSVLKHFFSVTEIKKKKKGKEVTPEEEKDSSPESDERFYVQFGDKRYIVEFDVNKEKVAYAKCGFFASCMYKLDIGALEAYVQYVSRDEHEKSFFCLKDDENADKQECSTEESQIGRSFIYFVGNTLLTSAKFVWKQKLSEEFSSFYEVLDTMESIRYTQHPENSFMTVFTNEQISICQAFGIEPPIECLPSVAKESLRKKLYPQKRGRRKKDASEDIEDTAD